MGDNRENKVTRPYIKTTDPKINTPHAKSKQIQKKAPPYTGSGAVFVKREP